MSTTSLYRYVGGLSFPAPETGETTLASLDPGRDVVLALLTAALNAELGPRWAAVRDALPDAPASPVASTLPHLPDLATVRQTKLDFPILAVYRSGEATLDYHSLARRRLTQEWSADYILGPLTTGNERRIGDVLIAALKVIDQTIEHGGHRAYQATGSGTAAAQADDVLTDYFSELTVSQSLIGAASMSEGGPKYWACTVRMKGVELDGDVEGSEAPLDGATITLGIGGPDGIDTDAIVGDTSAPLE